MFLCSFAMELRRRGPKWFPTFAYVFKCYICYICEITVLLLLVQVLILQSFLPFLKLHVSLFLLHWRTHQVLLSPSFSIMPNPVLPYFYALICFPNTFALLKPDGFVPLSRSHLQAHDVLSMEKRLGSSHWRRWTVLQEDCLSCWWQLLMLVSQTGFSLWYRALQRLITLTLSGMNFSGRLAVYSRKIEEENKK